MITLVLILLCNRLFSSSAKRNLSETSNNIHRSQIQTKTFVIKCNAIAITFDYDYIIYRSDKSNEISITMMKVIYYNFISIKNVIDYLVN